MTGTNTYTATDLQYVINEVIRPSVEREFEAELLAADFFTDLSWALAGGGNIVDIPDIYTNVPSVNTKSNASEVTLQSPATNRVQLTTFLWKEISYLIEDSELQLMLQSSDLLQALAEQAKYHVAKAADSAIFANYATISSVVSDTATDVTDSIIRQAIATVAASDVPFEQLEFFFHPTVIWQDLMGSSKYTNAYQSGVTPASVVTGNFGGVARTKSSAGVLYRIPVRQTTQIPKDGASTAFYNLLASPKAFDFAFRTPEGNRVRSKSSYQHPNLGTLWTNDSLYATGELRDAAAVVIKSRQSGIVS